MRSAVIEGPVTLLRHRSDTTPDASTNVVWPNNCRAAFADTVAPSRDR